MHDFTIISDEDAIADIEDIEWEIDEILNPKKTRKEARTRSLCNGGRKNFCITNDNYVSISGHHSNVLMRLLPLVYVHKINKFKRIDMNDKERRGILFQRFLEENDFYIDYNGVEYTLADGEKNIVCITSTNDEMHNFILGFNMMAKKVNDYSKMLDDLTEQNRVTVERYETIIKSLSENEEDTIIE